MRVSRVLGILGLVCVVAGFSKLPLLWNLSNVQVFVNSLAMAGTEVFAVVWGLLVVGPRHLAAIHQAVDIARQALGSVS